MIRRLGIQVTQIRRTISCNSSQPIVQYWIPLLDNDGDVAKVWNIEILCSLDCALLHALWNLHIYILSSPHSQAKYHKNTQTSTQSRTPHMKEILPTLSSQHETKKLPKWVTHSRRWGGKRRREKKTVFFFLCVEGFFTSFSLMLLFFASATARSRAIADRNPSAKELRLSANAIKLLFLWC